MSIQAITWALSCQVVGRGEKMVLVALANYADDEGTCWPSHNALARDTGYTRQGVAKVIKKLEAIGLLSTEERERENHSQSTNYYRWDMGATEVAGGQPQYEGGATGVYPHKEPPTEPSISSPQRARDTRATRLPDDWAPSPDEVAFAEQEGLSSDEVSRECSKFRDYWHGVGGQKGAKRDWPATWRNWIRRAADDRRHGRGRSAANGPQSSGIVAAANRQLDRLGREHGGPGDALGDVWGAGQSDTGGSVQRESRGAGAGGGGADRQGVDGVAGGDEIEGNAGRGHGPGDRSDGSGTSHVSGGRDDGGDPAYGTGVHVFPVAGGPCGGMSPPVNAQAAPSSPTVENARIGDVIAAIRATVG